MNPHQKNKVDLNALSADEQRLFRLYGKLPNRKDLLQNKLKERKYFDSGDYALSKAGKASDSGVTSIGTEHPRADDIPHASPLTNTIMRADSISMSPGSIPIITSHDGQSMLPGAPTMHRGSINGIPGGGFPGGGFPGITSRSPVKESSYLARSASLENSDNSDIQKAREAVSRRPEGLGSMSSPGRNDGIPIRR